MPAPADLAALAQDYRIALLRYLRRREESALADGYALGRRAMANEVSLLDLVIVHHGVLAETLDPATATEHAEVARAAGVFFTEVVAAYEMSQRRLQDGG